MSHLAWTRSVMCGGAAALAWASLATPASALCINPPEAGLWQSTAGDPYQVEIRMAECGDTNTQPHTTYKVTAIVKQSTGNLYRRPPVTGKFTTWTHNGTPGKWMVARVTTGGYQDVMHMRVTTSFVRRPGSNYRPRRVLQARIYHKSLDSKPSSWSGYTYTKIANR